MNIERDFQVERQNAYGTSKEQILKAAQKLFAIRGYRNTTLKDVARESSANTALVGYHFGNKEGLRQAVVDLELKSVNLILDSALSLGEKVTVDNYNHLIDFFLGGTEKGETFFRLFHWSIFEGGQQADKFVQTLLDPLIGKAGSIIGRIRPELSALEQEARALTFFGLINQYAYYRFYIHSRLTSMQTGAETLVEYEHAIRKQLRSLVVD